MAEEHLFIHTKSAIQRIYLAGQPARGRLTWRRASTGQSETEPKEAGLGGLESGSQEGNACLGSSIETSHRGSAKAGQAGCQRSGFPNCYKHRGDCCVDSKAESLFLEAEPGSSGGPARSPLRAIPGLVAAQPWYRGFSWCWVPARRRKESWKQAARTEEPTGQQRHILPFPEGAGTLREFSRFFLFNPQTLFP